MYRVLTNNENNNFNINNPDTLNTIDYLCTDGHHAYDKIANHYLYRNNIKKHIISKKETSYIESWNNKLRSNLSKLNRDTQRFPKSKKPLKIVFGCWVIGSLWWVLFFDSLVFLKFFY